MRIETKEVRGDYKKYLKFGWQFTEDVTRHSGRSLHTYHILARDMDMKNYLNILKLETQYFNLEAQRKPQPEYEISTAILLFLIFIIPGVIYCLVINSKKEKVDEFNKEIYEAQYDILQKVEQLI